MKFRFLMYTFLFVLVGCATAGNESLKDITEEQVGVMITEGVTTRDEIQSMFGSPMESTYTDGGALIWTYMYDDTSALTPETIGSVILTAGLAGTKARGVRSQLVILFNEDDVVQRFNMSNSDIESGTLLFGN